MCVCVCVCVCVYFLVKPIIAKAKSSKRTFRGWGDIWLWIFFVCIFFKTLNTKSHSE